MKTHLPIPPEICNVLYYKRPETSPSRWGVGHLLNDKRIGRLAGMLVVTGLLLTGRPVWAASCCAAKETPKADACCAALAPAVKKPDACCAEMKTSAAAAFSAESLYQLDATFTDDRGRPFALGSLRGRPVVLTMFFASCGYACPLLLTDMQAIRAKLPAEIRDEAAFVLVSFDVARDTPAALAQYRDQRQLDGQWTLLHGNDDAVRELAALLGVKFKQEADGMFAHSNLITILNPAGEVVHQRNGLRGGLDETALAVAAAAR